MTNASRDITKRKRPPQKGTPVLVRFQPDQLAAIDNWAASEDHVPTRPEAVRRLINFALKATLPSTKDRAAFSRRFNRTGKTDD